MVGLELFGITLVLVAIVYAFYKKEDKVGLALIIVLLVILVMLMQRGKINIF